MSDELPPTFRVRLGARTRVLDGGRTLVGGTAGRVVRLAPEAAALLGSDRTVSAGTTAGRTVARMLLDAGLADPVWPDPVWPDPIWPDQGEQETAAVHDVTVVVPVRDRPEALDRLLGALPRGVPVVVVDDASRRPLAVAVVADQYGARLLTHRVNRGPAAARNTGLGVVETPYVVFCDSDVCPDPGWLTTLLRHLDDPAVALVAPRITALNDAGGGWLERYERVRSSLDLGPQPAAVRHGGVVSYLPSACLLARVEAVSNASGGSGEPCSLQGFDEEMRSGEDVDLVWRTLASGWRVRYEPAARVRHDHRTCLRPWLARRAFYGTSAAPLATRHGPAVAPMLLAPWTLVVTLALLAQRRWSAPVIAGSAAVTTAVLARRLPGSDRPLCTAAQLTAEGLVATGWQTASALNRHYWPLAALAAVGSRRARRAVLVAALADGLADWRRTDSGLDPVRYLAARRLDDWAYGAGLWAGALRSRSVAALSPRVSHRLWRRLERTDRRRASSRTLRTGREARCHDDHHGPDAHRGAGPPPTQDVHPSRT